MITHKQPFQARFLLVEDNDSHVRFIERILEKENLPVILERVPNGEVALAYLRKQPPYTAAVSPHAILLDLNLPRLDGHQFLRIVKADKDLRHVPVIVLTTSTSLDDRAKAYEQFANSYLVKPADFEAFRDLIHEIFTYWGFVNQIATEDEN